MYNVIGYDKDVFRCQHRKYLNPMEKAFERDGAKVHLFTYLFKTSSSRLWHENYQEDKFCPWPHGINNLEILTEM